jgi:hypothetical protein
MAKPERKREDCKSLQGEAPQKYVVPESEIRDFIGSLSVVDVSSVAARFQVVADLTSGAFEERIDELSASDFGLIKRIADEDSSARYRRLMSAVIDSLGNGRQGINAAHLTASRAVELAFRCTREYFSAMNSYRRTLRLRLLDRSPHRPRVYRRSGGQ